jgi:hypothetical protein
VAKAQYVKIYYQSREYHRAEYIYSLNIVGNNNSKQERMKQLGKVVVIGIFIFVVVAGCKKNNNSSAVLTLDLHNYVDTSEIVFSSGTYRNSMGRNMSFSKISYYISNIQLTGTDGSIVPVTGISLVIPGTQQYLLGSVPAGTYKSISFNVGVPAANNHDDLSMHTGSDPLANSSMHFATDSLGYIFMDVEGGIDSSGSGTGGQYKTFSYHIGTDALLKTVSLGDHSTGGYAAFTATASKIMLIHLIADFGVLTHNVDMNAHPITNTSDYPAVADSLANNIPAMFRYQQ